jgi:hypothetical protein
MLYKTNPPPFLFLFYNSQMRSVTNLIFYFCRSPCSTTFTYLEDIGHVLLSSGFLKVFLSKFVPVGSDFSQQDGAGLYNR